MSPEDLNVEAARRFPVEWAQMELTTGKKRSRLRARLRKRAEYLLKTEPLRAAGARCANCKHWKPYDHGKKGEHYCEVDSDFYGYTLTKHDDLCEHWKVRS